MNQRLITILGTVALVVAVGLGVTWFSSRGPTEKSGVPQENGKDLTQKDNDPSKKDAPPGRSESPWLDALVSTDASTRRAALGQLEQKPEDLAKAVPLLLKNLDEKDPATRTALSDFLAALGREDGPLGKEGATALRGQLVGALKDQPGAGKAVAALTLGKIGQTTPAALEPLHSAQFGEDKDLQRVAALVLRKVAPRQVSDFVLPEGADTRSFPVRWLRMTHLRTTSSDDTPAIPYMIEALKDSDPAMQQWAAEFFSEEGDAIQTSSEAVPALLLLFQGKRESVAQTAARALGKLSFRDGSVIPLILKALGDSNPVMRQRAALALSRAGRVSTEPGSRVQIARELQSGDAVATLTKALADTEPTLRAQAIQTLGWIGPDAAPAVSELTRIAANAQGEKTERVAALSTLGFIGKEPATVVPLLLKSLKDADEDLRRSAVAALARYGDEAIPGLRKAVGEDDPDIRMGAFQALATIGPTARAALPELTALLKNEQAAIRAQTAVTLMQIDPSKTDVIPLIRAGLEIEDSPLRQGLLESIRNIGPAASPLTPDLARLLESADKELPYRAADALGAIGPAAATSAPALAAVIMKCPDTRGDGSPIFLDSPIYLSRKAIEALRQMGPDAKAAIPALVAVLEKCADIEAADALSVLDPARLEGRAALLEGARSPIENLRETGLRAIGRLGPAGKDAVPTLMEILPRESNLASPVTEALIRLGPVSVPALVQALEDKNARFQALHTLGRLGPIAREAAPAMLKASQAEFASEGMLAIAMLGEGAVPTLVEGAQDATRAMHALRALASLKERAAGATKALSDLLLANDYPEKAEVLRTLASIGPDAKSAGMAITATLKDPSEEIQAAAALAAVAVLGDGKTAAPVVLKLVVEAKNPQARRDAALALARIPAEAAKALPLLRPLLADSQAVLRVAGAQALGLLGKEALPALPDLIKATSDAAPEVQETACQALGNLGAEAAAEGTPALVALLKPGVPEKVQLAALRALGKWGAEATAAGPALRAHLTALRENDLTTGELQVQTARTLWKIEGKAALSVVRESVVRQLKTQTYPPALGEALVFIGEVGPALGDLAPMLATRVDSAYQVIRQGSIRALGRMGPAAGPALPWLQRAASQETDPALRQQAKDAIAAIQKG